MELRQLRYFMRIVELKSLTKASAVLHIAQPALGQHVRRLEDELGVLLFTRHSRGVEPTDEGRMLFDKAREILALADDAVLSVRDLKTPPRGTVVVGMTPGVNYMLSARLVQRCLKEFPEIALNIVEDLSSILTERVSREVMDMAFAITSVSEWADSDDLIAEPLVQEDLLFVSRADERPPSDDPIEFADIAGRPLIVLGSTINGVQHGLHKTLAAASESNGIPLDIRFEIQSVSVVKDLVEAGVGCSILPSGAVHHRVLEGTLRAKPITNPSISRNLYLVSSGRRPRSKAEAAIHDLIFKLVADGIDDQSGYWRAPS